MTLGTFGESGCDVVDSKEQHSAGDEAKDGMELA